MSYGIEFKGANNQIIFDTDNLPSAKTFTIQDGHPTTLTNNSTVEVPSGAFAFFRVDSGNCYTWQYYDQSSPPKWILKNKSGQTITYFFMRPMDDISNISSASTGGYGLEIYGPPDSQGNQEITFSTRRVADQVVDFHRIFDSGSAADSTNVLGSLTSSSGFYVSARTTYYDFSTGGAAEGPQYNTVELAINGFQFTSNSILIRNFREITSTAGNEGGDWMNPGGIIVAKIVS